MWFNRMELEVWFDKYQYEIDFDIGESAVKTLAVKDIDIDLSSVLLRYGYHRGRPDLRECLAGHYPGLTSDNIIITTGASDANFVVIAALAKPGDHIVVELPNYPSLYEVPRSLGCKVDLLKLKWENRFRPNLDELDSLVTPATKLISLTHPNNPTGSIISTEDLERIIKIAEKNDTYLLFDETYRHLAFENRLPPAASLNPRVISISSMSKCYGIPGIRTGWLATKDQFILDTVLAIREQLSIANNVLSEEIALTVLRRKEILLESARKRIEENRAVVSDWIDGQAILEWIPPETGVVSFPRIKEGLKIDPEGLYQRLAEHYRTFVVPGRCFEMDNRHFRLGFGSEVDEIRSGLKNLGEALEEFH